MGMEFQLEKIDFFAREIEKNISDILAGGSEDAINLWSFLQTILPVEVALILNDTDNSCALSLLNKMDEDRAVSVFSKLSVSTQAQLVPFLDIKKLSLFFQNIPSDDLTNLFEAIPDKNLERYLYLPSLSRREKIILSLKAEDKSAGRILNSDVLILHKELTVKKVISLLQQLDKSNEILPRQYVVDAEFKLIGYIEIVDLLKNSTNTKIEKLLHFIDVKVLVSDDQEEVAEIFKHYDIFSVPVTDLQNNFLGIISSNDVIAIMEEELTEDTYKMSGVAGMEHTYVNIGFWKIIFQRCKWLIPLLLFQSLSSVVANRFEGVLSSFGLIGFLTMLVGTGGNVGNQSVTFIVRGLATGEINRKNKRFVLLREILISVVIGLVLAFVAFIRVRLFSAHYPSVFTIIISLFFIIVTSVLLGTSIPVVLDAWDVDPAHSAAPFIATLMDIIGVTIYCIIATFLLS